MQGGFLTLRSKTAKNPKHITLRSKKAKKSKNVTLRKKKGGGCGCEAASKFPHSLGGNRKRTRRNKKNA
jgi:hypothetical protein